jgi:c-di-GMP-binding flagellar brake protein YcgR
MPSSQSALSKLRENKAVFLRLAGTAEWKKSRIEAVLGNYLYVAHPLDQGHLWQVSANENLEIGFSSEEEFYTFLSAILDFRKKPLPQLILQRPSGNELVMVQRRKSLRVYSLIPLFYEIPRVGGLSPGHHTLALNLSSTGLSFNATQPISRGSQLKMEVQIPNSTAPISARGEVVACLEVNTGKEERYKIRVKFYAITQGNRQRINDFVKQRRESQEKLE